MFINNAKILSLFLWLFCRDYDGKVTPEKVAAAAMYLKGIQELITFEKLQGLPNCCGVVDVTHINVFSFHRTS